MGRLTTHALDLAAGVPARGLRVELFRVTGEVRIKLASAVLNSDGRSEGALLEGDTFTAGSYELVFQVRDYFAAAAPAGGKAPFFDAVPVRFEVADPSQHYHVPLLVSPYGYSTYRGS